MKNILTGFSISLLIIVVNIAVFYAKKKGWLQSKKLIFVGTEQFIFVYILLGISITTAVLAIPHHNSIFSYTTLLLLFLTFVLSVLNYLAPPENANKSGYC